MAIAQSEYDRFVAVLDKAAESGRVTPAILGRVIGKRSNRVRAVAREQIYETTGRTDWSWDTKDQDDMLACIAIARILSKGTAQLSAPKRQQASVNARRLTGGGIVPDAPKVETPKVKPIETPKTQ